MARLIALLLVSGMLGACSSHTPPAATTSSSAMPASAVTNVLAGTPMAAYGHALNKAKNVQNVVDEAARKQAAQIEAATSGSSH